MPEISSYRRESRTVKRAANRRGPRCWLLAIFLLASLSPVEARSPHPPGRQRPIELVALPDSAEIAFTPLYGSPDRGYITEMAGSGGAWLDYDVDGWIDLVLVNALPVATADPPALTEAYSRGATTDVPDLQEAGGHRMFRNRDTTFVDVTAAAGVGDVTWGNGTAIADVDNDGFADLYITAIGPNRLYRNNGDGTFAVWPAGVEDPRWGTSATFTDWDGDGNVDLYVANYVDFDAAPIPGLGEGACLYRGIEVHCGPEGLAGEVDAFYRNRGDGSFVPWPDAEVDPDGTFGLALVASDCDGDSRPDLYVATDSTMNLLYRHGADDELLDWSLFGGAGYSVDGREQAGMAATAADYDGDGDFDLFVTNFQHDYNTLYRNLGDCTFEDVSEQAGLAVSSLPYMGWGAQFLDIDGDGDQDLFVANGHVYPQLDAEGLEPWAQRNLLYVNQLAESGEPRFVEVEGGGSGMGVLRSSRGALVADYDNDADPDLLVTNIDAPPTLLRNDSAMAAPALRLTLVGRTGSRSAYGAVVEVELEGDGKGRGASEGEGPGTPDGEGPGAADGKRRGMADGKGQGVSGIRRAELHASDGYVGSNDTRLLLHIPGGVAKRVRVRWPGGATTALVDLEAGWIVVDELRGMIARREAR